MKLTGFSQRRAAFGAACLAAMVLCLGPVGCAQMVGVWEVNQLRRSHELLQNLDRVMQTLVQHGRLAADQAAQVRAAAEREVESPRYATEADARAAARNLWLRTSADARAGAVRMLADVDAGARMTAEMRVLMSTANDDDAKKQRGWHNDDDDDAQADGEGGPDQPAAPLQSDEIALVVIGILLAVLTLLVIILAVAA